MCNPRTRCTLTWGKSHYPRLETGTSSSPTRGADMNVRSRPKADTLRHRCAGRPGELSWFPGNAGPVDPFKPPARRRPWQARSTHARTTGHRHRSSATYVVRKIDRQIIPDEKEFSFFPH